MKDPSDMKMRAKELALQLISDSAASDFPDPLDWGQWARRIASAARDGKLDQVAELAEPVVAGIENIYAEN